MKHLFIKFTKGDYRAVIDGKEVKVFNEGYCTYLKGICWTIVTRPVNSSGNWCNPSKPFPSKKWAMSALEAGEYGGVKA
tara:strand:+ start:3236 stop:3472 length:237 start_codon:yes stop_codon:yes gene_type:complete